MRRHLKLLATALLIWGAADTRASGIPVIDVANLAQAMQQVINDITAINNQVQQILQLQAQLRSMSGVRNLGNIFNDAGLMNYVPAQVHLQFAALGSTGYDGLGSAAKVLRDAQMIYNCLDRDGTARVNCQAALALPYQHKAAFHQAMATAGGRLRQIQALMREIDATQDLKSIQELQARIGAENAMLAHETSQIQLLQGLADSEERISRSRERERQYEMLSRTGQIADQLR